MATRATVSLTTRTEMVSRWWTRVRNRVVASDPGYVRFRLALSAVIGIAIAATVLVAIGQPRTVILVAAISAMSSTFTVTDPTPRRQAITLALVLVAGASSLTAASFGVAAPPLDSVLFVLLIFVAVYVRRFGPRGTALGTVPFFLFFFAMFLQIRPAQLPVFLLGLLIGLSSNAVVRFLILPRRPEAELLRIRRAFRARLGAVVRAAETYLATDGSSRSRTQLRKTNDRLHECVLLVEDTASEVIDDWAVDRLRRRILEVELAVQWLSITTRRTVARPLPAPLRNELILALRRFQTLIERDPRELPLISNTSEFSTMLVEGSKLKENPTAGDELKRAIADLALADVNAQRIAERDYSAEDATVPEQSEPPKDKAFVYDNQTRSAIQAVVGGGLAVIGGELVSHQRWYWAVLTVFVVFLGTSTAGATFVKGARRLGGTMVGIGGGVVLALLVGSNTPATVALILACVFGLVYTARVSQVLMAFFITSMLGLLYSLLGTFSFEVLWIRLAETAVGATAGILAAVVIVPVRTQSVMLDDIGTVLDELQEFLTKAVDLLSGTDNVNIIELSRELDRDVEQVRTTLEPFIHPINISSRRDYGWYILTNVETIAFRARHVAARATPGLLADDPRLTTLVDRIKSNVDVLAATIESGNTRRKLVRDGSNSTCDKVTGSDARMVLSSLGQLDEAVIALGRAFNLDTTDSIGDSKH